MDKVHGHRHYRRTGRGDSVANIETSDRNGRVMASFTVFEGDQLMLVTNHDDNPHPRAWR